MNRLIISANPSSKGFTHTIVAEKERLSKENGDKMEVLDLYKTELKQDFLRYEEKNEIGKDSITKNVCLQEHE